ncbi:GSCOCG00012988001-RA-CDS [Cotesia congregata]|nr:GSCOCG00012988001-RA-CDS [Cotesia congregata]
MKKGSDFSSDPITKRLTDITNIMNKSFADIKKTVAQIESKYSSELKELRGLVQILIDNWNEFKSMPSTSSSRALEERTGFPESGFVRRSDNSIHLGEGVYISKKTYDSIASDATSNAVFVKKIIMTQYTPEEIITYSVKGGKSNKIKMTSRKPGLDPTIRLAVKGIFRYYLSTRYTDEAYINAEVDKCDDHIRRKISDLRKKARPAKVPKSKKSSSSDDPSGSSSSDSDDAEPKKKSRNRNVSSGSDDSEKAEPKKKSCNRNVSSGSDDSEKAEPKKKSRKSNASSSSNDSDNSSDHSRETTSQLGDKLESKENEPLGDE